MASSPVLTGACACGAVRYEIDAPLTAAVYCHCGRCQRRSGAAAGPAGRVAPGSVRVVAGEEQLRAWDPDGGREKVFCGTCGSGLFVRTPDDGIIVVRLGSLDQDPGVRPSARVFVDYAATWESIPDDGLPRFPERSAV